MKILTPYKLAANAAKRHLQHYQHMPEEFCTADGRNCHETQRRLAGLGERPDPDDVDAIMGNTSWTDLPKCVECGTHPRDRIAMLRDASDEFDGPDEAYVCFGCLRKALEMMVTGREPEAVKQADLEE